MSEHDNPTIDEMIATVNERIEQSQQTLEEAGEFKLGQQSRRQKRLFPW